MTRFLLALAAVWFSPVIACGQAARTFHIPSLYHVGYWVRDVPKARAFYSGYLGFADPYHLKQLVVMKVNDRQVIYLFDNAARIRSNGDNLDHLGLETDDVAAMHDYLVARGVKVGQPHRAHIGDLILGVKDPDGHPFEVTQFEPEGQLRRHQGQSLPSSRISSHLRSATITVADLPASLHFYRDILGFKMIKSAAGVCVRVPDGTDFLRLVPATRSPTERAVPEYCLAVPDAAETQKLLAVRARAAGFPAPSAVEVGPDGATQTSCVDPDGTRVIFRSEKVLFAQ